MNNLFIFKAAVIIVTLSICCQKDDNYAIVIIDGYYEGYYAHSGDTIWEAISFKTDSFHEQPSGGLQLDLQKWPCIVKGTYNIIDSMVLFEVSKYPRAELQCDTNIYLSGEYTIKIKDENVVFWKGEDDQKQTYNMKLISASR